MPGYEPFLLCDFHVHTQWSDGRLGVREVVDLYGRHRPLRRDRDHRSHPDEERPARRAPAALATLRAAARSGSPRTCSTTYLDDIRNEAERARREYGMLVVPGAEITQNRLRGQEERAHHRARHQASTSARTRRPTRSSARSGGRTR